MTTLTATLLPTGGAGPAADGSRVLVVLPSLGTAVQPLWQYAAAQLPGDWTVVGVDLPGHGRSAPVAARPGIALTMEDLAEQVLESVRSVLPNVGSFAVAGDSVGGAIALQLALSHPELVDAAGVFCSGAKIGTAEAWEERAAFVEEAGTPTMVEGSVQRWFAPGFIEAQPVVSTELLHSLQGTDRFSYAAVCRALATFDVRDRLKDVRVPILAVAGEHDQPTPPASLKAIADGVPHGRFEVVADAAHLVPAEAPEITAELLHGFLSARGADAARPAGATGGAASAAGAADARAVSAGTQPAAADVTAAGLPDLTRSQVHEAGTAVRREVLSDEHVDRANAEVTDFTRDFQDYISRYAWGEIWTRPGIDRRMRSAVTLTAMVAGGHQEELAMHVRAAVRNGLTRDEIKEILLQSAVYCSVPSANTAFKIAGQVLADLDAE